MSRRRSLPMLWRAPWLFEGSYLNYSERWRFHWDITWAAQGGHCAESSTAALGVWWYDWFWSSALSWVYVSHSARQAKHHIKIKIQCSATLDKLICARQVHTRAVQIKGKCLIMSECCCPLRDLCWTVRFLLGHEYGLIAVLSAWQPQL